MLLLKTKLSFGSPFFIEKYTVTIWYMWDKKITVENMITKNVNFFSTENFNSNKN